MVSPVPPGESPNPPETPPITPVVPPTPPAKPAESEPVTPEVQARIDAAAANARRQGEQDGRKAAEADAKRKAAEEKAKESGEFQQLAEARATEIADLKAQLAARDRTILVAKVAAKHGLPDTLAGRLIGTTEEELEADAKALAKDVAPRKAPDTEAGVTSATPVRRTDRPGEKKIDGPVYAFDGVTKKVPWTHRQPPT